MCGVQVKSESPPDFVPGDQKRIFLTYLCDLTQGNQPLPQVALLTSGSQRGIGARREPELSVRLYLHSIIGLQFPPSREKTPALFIVSYSGPGISESSPLLVFKG